MKKVSLVLLFLVLSFSSIAAQQKYALIIGNGTYRNLRRLNNPENDANDMKTELQRLGFNVDTIIDGDRVQMEEAIERFRNRLSVSKNSYGFFFYAGHGVQSGGTNYLIPVDADIRSESYLGDRAVSVQSMLNEINQAGNELNIVVLDACRDNPFSWGRGGFRGLQVVNNQPADSIIVYATSAGSTAADGTGRNGVFTSQLLKNLKIPDLDVGELFRLTGGDVARVSGGSQRPAVYNQFYGIAYLGSRPAAPAPAPQPTPAPAPRPTPAPVHPAAPPQRPISDGFVRIRGGTFTMGSPTSEVGYLDNEGPQHQVTVSDFYLGKYEVTQAEYRAVMGTNPSDFKGDTLPVENVSWIDAVNYCNERSRKEGLNPAYTVNGMNVSWNRNAQAGTAGYRLPTEAEWEYACRAGTKTPFSMGNNLTTSQANYNGNYPYSNAAKGTYREKTTTVGSFAPNGWGLYDMHGNVREWCWDWYGNYGSGAQTDPVGASSGMYRVERGGCWNYTAQILRSAHRGGISPSYRSNSLGFRLVRPSL
jgi:formylglycine-generating enzyme required for sulfatase activity